MTLPSPDLIRNFMIGFIAGGAILATGLVDGVEGFGPGVTAEAQASEKVRPVSDDLDISADFLIEAEKEQP